MGAETAVARFTGEPGECWVWPGNPSEYPKVWVNGHTEGAHRFVLSLRGAIPEGHDAAHSCDNKRCVNPDHISAETRSKNISDGYKRGLIPRVHGAIRQRAEQTECIHGHAFTEENTYRAPNGTRKCRRCHADTEARRRARA